MAFFQTVRGYNTLQRSLQALGKAQVLREGLDGVSKPYTGPRKQLAVAHVKVENAAQVGEVLNWAKRTGHAVIPQGGNTNLVMSGTPLRSHQPQLILTVNSNQIEVCDQSLIVGAGVTIQEIQAAAKKMGGFFPVKYASEGTATFGGGVATRAMGMGLGIPEVCTALEVVDGLGETHHLELPGSLTRPRNSMLPGKDDLWPFANQGFLGVVVQGSVKVSAPDLQSEVLFVGGNDLAELIKMVRELKSYLDETKLPASLQIAELIYRSALENVLDRFRDPLDQPYAYYMLIKVGSKVPENTLNLKRILEDRVTTGIMAQTETQAETLFQMREALSDAARRQAVVQGYTPIPFDLSCESTHCADMLSELNNFVLEISPNPRLNVFGHLNQGNGETAAIHYNLGAFLQSPSEMREIKTSLLDKLYSLPYQGLSHSAEHGGLGADNLAYTVKYAPLEDLLNFAEQLKKFNPESVLNGVLVQQFFQLLEERQRS